MASILLKSTKICKKISYLIKQVQHQSAANHDQVFALCCDIERIWKFQTVYMSLAKIIICVM